MNVLRSANLIRRFSAAAGPPPAEGYMQGIGESKLLMQTTAQGKPISDFRYNSYHGLGISI